MGDDVQGWKKEDQDRAAVSVNCIYKDLPGFPSLQEILGDVFSEVFFTTDGPWGSIKNQFIVQMFLNENFLF